MKLSESIHWIIFISVFYHFRSQKKQVQVGNTDVPLPNDTLLHSGDPNVSPRDKMHSPSIKFWVCSRTSSQWNMSETSLNRGVQETL